MTLISRNLTQAQVDTLNAITDTGSGVIITTAERNELGFITVTGAVDLDTIASASHDAVTLNTGAVTTAALNLTGQELEIKLASALNAGIITTSQFTLLDNLSGTNTGDQTASQVSYNNVASGLTATQVQAAIDELDSTIDGLGTSSHAAFTLNAGVVTQESADLTGQELTLNQVTPTSDGVMTSEDKTKLNNIEANAAADQTGAEIKAAYEAEANTNAYTDTEKTKLLNIESNATADQNATEVPYTPTTVADWDVTPTEVSGGLDELADRVEDLENVTAFTDELVKVSVNDTTGGYLLGKIESTTTEVSITEIADGGNEKLRINVDLSAFEVTGHTHTASEITDFDTEVSNNTDVAANTLAKHNALTLGGVASDTTDDTLDLVGQVLTVNAVTTTTDGAMTAADKLKLDGIEAGAGGDLTAGEIKTLYESNLDTNAFTNSDETKLDGIEAGAQADQTASEVPFTPNGDIVSIDTQSAIVEVRNDTDTKLSAKVDNADLGVANGVATLDATGLVPASQLPSYVDDVLEYANLGAFPVTGETGKVYIAINTGIIYRWTGSIYTEISTTVTAPSATESLEGIAEIATQTETDTGTDDTRFITPLKLANYSGLGTTTTIFTTAGQPIISGALATIAHGLVGEPDIFQVYLECIANDNDYVIGDKIIIDNAIIDEGKDRGVVIFLDATNIIYRLGNENNVFATLDKLDGKRVNLDNPSWELYIKAIKF